VVDVAGWFVFEVSVSDGNLVTTDQVNVVVTLVSNAVIDILHDLLGEIL
jgi:hypothetical protein